MFPPLQALAALLIAFLSLEISPPLAGPLLTPLATILLTLLPVPAGALLLRRLASLLGEREETDGDRVLVSLQRALSVYRSLPLLAFTAASVLFGWPRWLLSTPLGEVSGAAQAGFFLPYLLALLLHWVYTHRAERLFRFPATRLREYLSLQVRQVLLVFAPVLFLWAVLEGIEAHPVLRLHLQHIEYLRTLTLLAFLSLLFILSPLLLRLVFGGRPLPEGALRDRLLRFSGRLGFRPRDILVWPTRLHLINAAVVGVLPGLQYVFLTDGLLESFSADEVEAVYAHEAGHARRRHLLFYLLFGLGFVVILSGLGRLLVPEGGGGGLREYAIQIPTLFLYWFVYFGFLSRRIERDADLFGARALGDPERFVETLEAVAWRSGNIRHLRSWRHGSVAERVEFLRRAAADPGTARRARRSLSRAVAAFLVLFAASAVAAFWDAASQHRAGRFRVGLALAFTDFREGRYAEVHRIVAEGAGHPEDPLSPVRAAVRFLEEAFRGGGAAAPDPEAVERARRAQDLLFPDRTGSPAEILAFVQFLRAEFLYLDGDRETAARLFRRAWISLGHPRSLRVHMHRLGLLPGE